MKLLRRLMQRLLLNPQLAASALCCCLVPMAGAAEQAEAKHEYNLPRGDAAAMLGQFASVSGRQVIFMMEKVRGERTNAVVGVFSAREALDRMLAGTGLVAMQDHPSGGFVIKRAPAPPRSPPSRPPAKPKPEKEASPTMKPTRTGLVAAMIGWLVATTPLPAQGEASGTVEGRIQDVTTGDYLNNARVHLAGTNVTVLTNEFGEYRISGVPAGEARLEVFYSGLTAQAANVNIEPGGRVVRDFEFKSNSPVVQMQAFTVRAEQLSEVALAVNEQRFAHNAKAVLAASEFGDQSEGNVAEFLKFMPGMEISYVEQDARNVSVRGMPAHTTIVQANGNELASAASSGASRVFEFEQISMNDVAQIEFNKTLLPDMPAEGIGGTINLITKSAFQRSRPQFTYRAYLNFNTTRMELKKMPGPTRDEAWLYRPGGDFTYVHPVSKNFGYTVSGSYSSKYNPQYLLISTWNLNGDPATGAERPFLSQFSLQDSPKLTDRWSGRVSMDWRFARQHVLSLGFSEQYYVFAQHGRRWISSPGTNPTVVTPEFVQGRPNAGSVIMNGNTNDKRGTTYTPNFKYTYNGPVWMYEVRGAYSHSSNHYRNIDKGHFQGGQFSLGTLNAAGAFVAPTVRIDYGPNYVPAITSVGSDGAPLDNQDVNQYFIDTGVELWRESADVKKTLAFHGQRTLLLGIPVRLKAGGDIREAIRDVRTRNGVTYTRVGADGRTRTADDRVLVHDLVETAYSKVTPPYGLANFRWPSYYKLWALHQEDPSHWTRNLSAEHNSLVGSSRYIDESKTSGFLRLDAAFLQNRLTVVGGARFQSYRVNAESGVNNPLGRYLYDDEGNVIFDPATGVPIVGTATGLDQAKLTNVERGNTTAGKSKGYYPSLNIAYQLTGNLQIRFGYAHSVNYPDLGDVASSTTLTDLVVARPRLTATSPLEPWFGKNYDLGLEYYTPNGGAASLSYFRKDLSNFVQQVTHLAGTSAAKAALERYGYGGLYALNYEVVEKFNGGDASFDGWDFDLRQNLDRHLPEWGRGLTVFFNTSYKAAPKGLRGGDIGAYSQRTVNWGARYQRGRLGLNLKWNHVPERKYTIPQTLHRGSRTFLDVDANYRISRRLSLFASGTNILSQATEQYLYTENTPEYARRRNFDYFGVQCTAGIKGEF